MISHLRFLVETILSCRFRKERKVRLCATLGSGNKNLPLKDDEFYIQNRYRLPS